jgi:hypothetical protein
VRESRIEEWEEGRVMKGSVQPVSGKEVVEPRERKNGDGGDWQGRRSRKEGQVEATVKWSRLWTVEID